MPYLQQECTEPEVVGYLSQSKVTITNGCQWKRSRSYCTPGGKSLKRSTTASASARNNRAEETGAGEGGGGTEVQEHFAALQRWLDANEASYHCGKTRMRAMTMKVTMTMMVMVSDQSDVCGSPSVNRKENCEKNQLSMRHVYGQRYRTERSKQHKNHEK